MLSALIEPTDWVLEISPQQLAWQEQAHTHAWGRWNGYLNQLCLETILPWLKAEYLPTATTWVDSSLMPLVWDVVNGAVITVGTKRIALIPTEAIDRSELEVPQEWVDIPSWAADYYLGVQVAHDESAIHIYGYTTHQQLKTQASYDPQDRTYCLDEGLNPDLNALWLTIDSYPVTAIRAALKPIPDLADDRITPLIDRLANPAEILPRLALPFEVWAALIDRPSSLQRLYQQRRTGQPTPITRLSDWLLGQIDAIWQPLDLVLLPPQIATAVRSADLFQLPAQGDLYRAKVYSFAAGEIALVIGISQISDTEDRIGLQIHPTGGATQLPGAISLRLLNADGSEIGQARAAVTETIQFQFRASVGEQFQIEIACAQETRIESFEL